MGFIILGAVFLLALYTSRVDFDNLAAIALWVFVVAAVYMAAGVLGITVVVMGN